MADQELGKHIDDLEQDLEHFKGKYDQIQRKLDLIEDVKTDIEKHVDVQASNIDFERLAEFVNSQYWLINEIDDNEYEVWIPSFMDVQAGVLDRQKGGYNVFILNQTTKLINGIPEFLSDEIDLDDEQLFKVKGDLLEFDESQKDVVEDQLSDHVEDVKDDKATIKQDHGHSLVRDLLDRGEMPFAPTPVDQGDLRESETNHELRPYQEDAYQEFLDHGAITVCLMTGAGKTHIGIEPLDTLKYDSQTGRKAVVVYNKIIGGQWVDRINEFAPRLTPINMSDKQPEDIPMDEEVVEIYTYQSLHKLEEMINDGYEYIMIQFDEADFLPAKTFSRASTYPAKYRIGHTASPVRSRENPNDVFALCGKPVGMNWKDTLEYMDQSMFPVNIHVVEDDRAKIDRTKDILDDEKSTLIIVENTYEDSIGQRLSEELGLEFVHGGTTGDQKEQVQDAIVEDNACIVSRIGRRGMSLPKVERLIEVDRRGDSRRDTVQVVGRLFHGRGEQADLIYTFGEANSFDETFIGLIDKEFEMNDIDDAMERDFDESQSVVDIDIEGGDQVAPEPESIDRPKRSSIIPDDPIEFLKDDEMQDIINERIKDSRYGQDKCWNTLIAIAQSENGLDHREIEDTLDVKEAQRITKPFRNQEPNILVENSDGKYELNIDEWQEIKKKEDEKRQKKEDIEELKEEIGVK